MAALEFVLAQQKRKLPKPFKAVLPGVSVPPRELTRATVQLESRNRCPALAGACKHLWSG